MLFSVGAGVGVGVSGSEVGRVVGLPVVVVEEEVGGGKYFAMHCEPVTVGRSAESKQFVGDSLRLTVNVTPYSGIEIG